MGWRVKPAMTDEEVKLLFSTAKKDLAVQTSFKKIKNFNYFCSLFQKHNHGKRWIHLYNLEICIYYEYFSDISIAIDRETELKKWSRIKKENLINSKNPEWKNLVMQ
jgi:hypothetical protein